MYGQFVKHENKRQNVPLTMMQRPESMIIPAVPRLQPFPGAVPPMVSTPVTDMEEMRAAQDKALNSYGYVDRQKGVVHIPIEEAKKLALQRVGQAPLSVPPAPAPAPAQAGVPVPHPAGGNQ